MGFLKKLFSSLSGGGGGADEGHIHREYIRCSRCGEQIAVRVDLRNELTAEYDAEEDREGDYVWRKGIVGSGQNRCFQTIEVELSFDANRQLASRSISGGEFITREEFDAQEQPGG
jgi:hypothetical protein